MNMPIDLRAKVDDYLAERHRLGFELRNMALALVSFASYVEHLGHQGPLTIDVMADWARQDKAQSHLLGTWARRLKALRPFTLKRAVESVKQALAGNPAAAIDVP